MWLCANENIAEDCVVRLRQDGHDVLWIRESTPGSPDEAVLARATAEERLLITFDKDFGELVFRRGAKASRGVVKIVPVPTPGSKPGIDTTKTLPGEVFNRSRAPLITMDEGGKAKVQKPFNL